MNDRNSVDLQIKPTKETYDAFQQAYEVLNRSLFGGELPNCLITLQRRKRSAGYFSGNRFNRRDGEVTDEIALNPALFRLRSVREVLSTLAHEMVHLWQHHFGKAGRGRYHNKQWAARMKAIGLHPSSTGEVGGKETGDRMGHFIIPHGAFDRVATRLIAHGFAITWTEKPRAGSGEGSDGDGDDGDGKSGKRVKYVCTDHTCDQKAWAKHGAHLICGHHMVPMEPCA